MARSVPFTAYSLNRKAKHTIIAPPSGPAKITTHIFRPEQWGRTGRISKTVRRSARLAKKVAARAKPAKGEIRAPTSAMDVLGTKSAGFSCLHCGGFDDSPGCSGTRCYKTFTKSRLLPAKAIEIRGPGRVGYGAYTAPGVTIKTGDWMGEYVGELRPLGGSSSCYRFEIPSVCAVDAEKAGNWTRFVNSSCRPNAKAWGVAVGKRHAVLLQATRDIGEGQEITIAYGRRYFDKAGFKCDCGVIKERHMPGGQIKVKRPTNVR